jgi:hypothetical protein
MSKMDEIQTEVNGKLNSRLVPGFAGTLPSSLRKDSNQGVIARSASDAAI